MQLWPNQEQGLQASISQFEKGIHRQVVSMATGTGKAFLVAYLLQYYRQKLGGQVLVLVHREELVDQLIQTIKIANPKLSVSKEKAEYHANPYSDIIVASVATLGRANSERANRFDWDNIRTIITDECHHASSQSYKNVYLLAGVLDKNTSKLNIGFTATPRRSDGVGLSDIYDKIVYEYPLKKAVQDGRLVDPIGIRIKTNVSLDAVKTKGDDFNERQLADTIDNPVRNKLIVQEWLKNAPDRHTVVFSASIKHAQNLAEIFKQHGVKAEAVWGDDPDRADKIARHKSKETQVLINCQVMTEGYDDPQIDCVVLARPSKSHVLFTQMIGRGTRIHPGKKDCLIIDVVDSTTRHNLVVLPTLIGLPVNLDLKGKGLVWAAEKLEEEQKKNPNVDFSNLQDIDNIDAYVESVDLFAEIKNIPEVEENSELIWHKSYDGGYILILPDKDFVKIQENLLTRWELSATIKGKRFKGERESMAEAFSAADDLIKKEIPEALTVVKREASWHDAPATDAQLKLIKKLIKDKPIPNNLSKGDASRIIGTRLAAKPRRNK